MARVWSFEDPNNPPEPGEDEPNLVVRTTKRNYSLSRAVDDLSIWFPIAAPANAKPWIEWLEFWGPLTAVE